MPALQSPVFEFPLQQRLRDLKTSLIGWGIYLLSLIAYCMIHQMIVSSSPPDVNGSIIWALREWGIWLLITPVAFNLLRKTEDAPAKHALFYLKLGTGILLVSLSYRVGLDYITHAHDIAPGIVIFFPRYLAALIVISVVWYMFLRNQPATCDRSRENDNKEPRKEPEYPKTLLVSKGNGEALIQVDQIQCISAAGNYVEIYCNNQLYLMRATMKQIEELLPPDLFLRTHRSHIINIREIDRIKSQPSGNGAVQLRCGKLLSISKKYKGQLQKYRLQTA